VGWVGLVERLDRSGRSPGIRVQAVRRRTSPAKYDVIGPAISATVRRTARFAVELSLRGLTTDRFGTEDWS
jgi:hypothetical protein